ncbi:MAG: hypothetical protein JRJ62_13805 [Deltaproteobacteria bacterium]|nr:hypothetical protein [Deltaproteobacteria bacterium]
MPSENHKPEPADHHTYSWVMFYRDTFHFFLRSVKFYVSLLKNDIQEIENDPDLKEIIEEEQKKSLPIYREHSKAKRIEEWLENIIKKAEPDALDYDVSISHGTVRFIKTACILYLKHLKIRRNNLSLKQNISRYVLETIDNQISSLEEKINVGVFQNASPVPFLVDELIEKENVVPQEKPSETLASAVLPRPIVIDSIQILDSELRERCLDLFDAFYKDGKHERFDTVISEAIRIFETRLRALSGAAQECVGVDLAQAAFGGEQPLLKVSDVNAEQQAVHLLFRGTFGFIRNRVQHKLLGKLSPYRVLQILAFIDYLLYIAENAERNIQEKE